MNNILKNKKVEERSVLMQAGLLVSLDLLRNELKLNDEQVDQFTDKYLVTLGKYLSGNGDKK